MASEESAKEKSDRVASAMAPTVCLSCTINYPPPPAYPTLGLGAVDKHR